MFRILFLVLGLGIALSAGGVSSRADDGVRWFHSFGPVAGGLNAEYHLAGHQTGGDPSTWALYGVTRDGGVCDVGGQCGGIVYRLTPPPPGGLHATFTRLLVPGCCTQDQFIGPLVFDAAGAAYGTTITGDTARQPYDTVFQLTPPTDGAYFWKKTILSKIPATSNGPILYPLFIDRLGAVFGSTGSCYSDPCPNSFIYKLTPPASGQTSWMSRTLYRAPASDHPMRILAVDAAGAVYATIPHYPGGQEVFVLTPPVSGGSAWSYGIVAELTASSLPVRGGDGALYGVSTSPSGHTIFRLTPPAAGSGLWTNTALWTLTNGQADSVSLRGLDANGNVDGWDDRLVSLPGLNPGIAGVQFKLLAPGAGRTAWTYHELRVLDPGHDKPYEGDPADPAGAIYDFGSGGANHAGVIVKIPPVGGG